MTSQRVFQIGNSSVDPGLDEIRHSGATTKVEPRTMRVLLLLAERAGEVVSVQELLDQVWKDVVVTQDSVYTAIAALRKAFGEDGEDRRYIVNVPRRGYRLVAAVRRSKPARPKRALTAWVSATLAAVLIALVLVVARSCQSQRPTVQRHADSRVAVEPTIVVLPFRALTTDHGGNYLAEGIAEEVGRTLGQLPGLRVVGWTSSQAMAQANAEDLRRRLNATHVVEGTVQRGVERIRVTARMYEASDGRYLWSEEYDRPATDALAIEDDIATGIARALEIGAGVDRHAAGYRPPSNEAYELYLRGRYEADSHDKDRLEKAMVYLQDAIIADPRFVDAYVTLTEAQYYYAVQSYGPPGASYEATRKTAERAIALAPHSGLAHAFLGAVHSDFDRDWDRAAMEFSLAQKYEPRDGIVKLLSAQLPLALGDNEAARALYKEALAEDPLLADAYQLLGWADFRAGRLDEAEAVLRRAYQIYPGNPWGQLFLGEVLIKRGRIAEALAEIAKEPQEQARLGGYAIAYYAQRNYAKSDEALNALVRGGSEISPTEISQAYAYRGDVKNAVHWLYVASKLHDPGLFCIVGDPMYAPVSGSAEFKEFLRSLRLPAHVPSEADETPRS